MQKLFQDNKNYNTFYLRVPFSALKDTVQGDIKDIKKKKQH